MVATLGTFNVSVQYTVPVQAQVFTPTGGGSTLQPPLYVDGVTYDRPTGTVVADGGNSSLSFMVSFVDEPQGDFKDALLLFVSGALKHQTKKVASYNPTTNIVEMTAVFSATPSPTDKFVLITF